MDTGTGTDMDVDIIILIILVIMMGMVILERLIIRVIIMDGEKIKN